MQPAPLVDIGINLTHESYDRDRDRVLARAAAAGVTTLVVTGADVAGSRAAAALAGDGLPLCRATAGVHPHHAASVDAGALGELANLARLPEVVAVGECGLDYHRMLAPREAQLAAFRAQVELAIAVGKPLFLHCREAHEDFVAVLAAYGADRPAAVVHCFTGSVAEVEACLSLGLYVGFTGWICDERRGRHLDAVVRIVPAERLLVETDGPYLLPRDLPDRPRDRRNEPSFLPHIVRAIAAARGEAPDTLARSSTAAARTLFGLSPPAAPAENLETLRE
jgi:TatD DNase family protein